MAVMSPLGDRLYLAFDHDVVALNSTTFDETARVRFDGPVIAMATTPSGDRVFVATEHSRDIAVLDRYSGERTDEVRLPGNAKELRMDPLGRLLLVRPDTGDSVWVISIGHNRLAATLPTSWRTDLPNVAPEGSVATVPDKDVHFTMPGQAKPRIIVRDGAAEQWLFVYWNGFRPRAPGLDQPVVFAVDTMSFSSPVRDSAPPLPPARVDTVGAARPAPVQVDTAHATLASVWTVQLAAVLSEERAKEIARGVRVDGMQPRVVVSSTEGARIYRVVIGPFSTKVEADRVGRQSGRSYWVFEGVP
jgi:cell division septation protein DedD